MEKKYSRPPEHVTDYVNHCIRFYITCPDGILTQDHSKAEINDWVATQMIFSDLDPEESRFLFDVYRRKGRGFSETVKLCAEVHNMTTSDCWKLIDRASVRIARARGLI